MWKNLNTRFLFTRSLCRFVRHVLRLRSSFLNLDAWDNENTFDSHAPTWAYGWYVRVVVRMVAREGQKHLTICDKAPGSKIGAWCLCHAWMIFFLGGKSGFAYWPVLACSLWRNCLYHIWAYIHGHRHPNLFTPWLYTKGGNCPCFLRIFWFLRIWKTCQPANGMKQQQFKIDFTPNLVQSARFWQLYHSWTHWSMAICGIEAFR